MLVKNFMKIIKLLFCLFFSLAGMDRGNILDPFDGDRLSGLIEDGDIDGVKGIFGDRYVHVGEDDLYHAFRKGHLGIASYLLKKGARVRDVSQAQALFQGFLDKPFDEDILGVALLLACAILENNSSFFDERKRTLGDAARQSGDEILAELIESRGK